MINSLSFIHLEMHIYSSFLNDIFPLERDVGRHFYFFYFTTFACIGSDEESVVILFIALYVMCHNVSYFSGGF